ncbi:MAG: DUF3780 domain-containing protein [Nitrococcus sp.]|nr:DUF3780 domain-containing protein [Nitrococcus sp.]
MIKQPPKAGRAPRPQHPTLGFGVPATFAPHHFVVSIPRGCQAVRISEDLGMHAAVAGSEVLDRTIIPRLVWNEIANPIQRLFNQRLKAHRLAASRWKVGENPVDRLLGKELCVLAWAVEELPPEKLGTALRNWLALRPEERWWLFGMTAASAGAPQDKGQGWRAALRHALGDTPAPFVRMAGRCGRKHNALD